MQKQFLHLRAFCKLQEFYSYSYQFEINCHYIPYVLLGCICCWEFSSLDIILLHLSCLQQLFTGPRENGSQGELILEMEVLRHKVRSSGVGGGSETALPVQLLEMNLVKSQHLYDQNKNLQRLSATFELIINFLYLFNLSWSWNNALSELLHSEN